MRVGWLLLVGLPCVIKSAVLRSIDTGYPSQPVTWHFVFNWEILNTFLDSSEGFLRGQGTNHVLWGPLFVICMCIFVLVVAFLYWRTPGWAHDSVRLEGHYIAIV